MVYLLAALPFIGILVGTPFVNRVEPLVVLSSIIMAIVYAVDPANKDGDAE
jgi:hypothetical protein